MSDFGVILEEEITGWRQLFPKPNCPNGLRWGLYNGSRTFLGIEINVKRELPPPKICAAENKETICKPKCELHQCLQREGGRQYSRKKMCLN